MAFSDKARDKRTWQIADLGYWESGSYLGRGCMKMHEKDDQVIVEMSFQCAFL